MTHIWSKMEISHHRRHCASGIQVLLMWFRTFRRIVLPSSSSVTNSSSFWMEIRRTCSFESPSFNHP